MGYSRGYCRLGPSRSSPFIIISDLESGRCTRARIAVRLNAWYRDAPSAPSTGRILGRTKGNDHQL
jgi:hypothetical protein